MRLENYILNESINDKGIFKAVFMAGTPGAGKSYVVSKVGGGVDPRIVNSDTWTEFLKVKADEWDKNSDRIRKLTKAQLGNYLNGVLPLWVDGTSSSPPAVFRREGILKSIGYDTAMIWVETDLETARKRAKEREAKIGRHVDDEFIVHVHDKIQKLKPYYQSHFSTFIEVNNSDGELTDKVIRKLYAKMDGFFNSELTNPIGKDLKEKMIANDAKYLVDLEDFDMKNIHNLTQGWFR